MCLLPTQDMTQGEVMEVLNYDEGLLAAWDTACPDDDGGEGDS